MDCLVITEFAMYPFSLNIRSMTEKRKGILLHAKTATKSAWAEVSPLPGFSQETLEEAEKQILALTQDLPLSLSDILQQTNLYPSVAFGLDSLQYHLYSSPPQLSTFPICAFLSADFQEMKRQIPHILSQRYKYVKIKISHLSKQEAHEILERLIGKIKIKIDLNRAWPLPEVLSFFQRYPQQTFEYIEEPVQNPRELIEFPYPFALDETLRENVKLPQLPFLRALIIKPMLMGSVSTILNTINSFNKLKPQIILSSSHESGVGLFHLCHLQQRCRISRHPLGVDTYRLIEKDILTHPHHIFHGALTLSALEVSDAATHSFM